jgi:hypothetical protein
MYQSTVSEATRTNCIRNRSRRFFAAPDQLIKRDAKFITKCRTSPVLQLKSNHWFWQIIQEHFIARSNSSPCLINQGHTTSAPYLHVLSVVGVVALNLAHMAQLTVCLQRQD